MADIPVLVSRGDCLARAWENSMIKVYNEGCEIKTQYDKPGDPGSMDCTMLIVVDEPFSEPMIHRNLPAGIADLEEYRQELCEGIKDHWVRDPNDPTDERWLYTYHQRFMMHNQIEKVSELLAKSPYSRRVQLTTWRSEWDMESHDPPCLQSCWFRILDGTLNMNVRFRSRDAYKAAFMNMWGLVHLQKMIADNVSKLTGEVIRVGRYVDLSDSYHIYGSYLEEFENVFLEKFKTTDFEERVWNSNDQMIIDLIAEAKIDIPRKIRKYDEEHLIKES